MKKALRHRLQFDFIHDGDYALNVCFGENAGNTLVAQVGQVGVGALVEASGVTDALLGQVVVQLVEKLFLRTCRCSAICKRAEGLLGGFPLETTD